jgi:hypothetical protein
VDGVNNIDTPTAHLLQGMPTYRTIDEIFAIKLIKDKRKIYCHLIDHK